MLKVSSPEKRKEMQKNKEKTAAKGEKMKPKIKKKNKQEEKIPANNSNCTHSGRGWKRLFIAPIVRADCVRHPHPFALNSHGLTYSNKGAYAISEGEKPRRTSADFSQRARLNEIPANNPNCTHSGSDLERLCITSNIRADCVRRKNRKQ